MFKSKTRPRCRCCGKPIPKHTTSIWFGGNDWTFGRSAKPATREEAQRLVNATAIASVRYAEDEEGRRYIAKVTTWDGESYQDEFFCRRECAENMGRAFALAGHACAPWIKAMSAFFLR